MKFWRDLFQPSLYEKQLAFNEGYRLAAEIYGRRTKAEIIEHIECRIQECVKEISGYCPPIRVGLVREGEPPTVFVQTMEIKPIVFRVYIS